MIGVINYGLGNVRAILAAYASIGIEARALTDPHELHEASKLILPGVGSFDHALGRLERQGFIPVIRKRVEGEGVPILGICLGMQLLASSSDEGSRQGFGWVEGRVRSFEALPATGGLPVPHMGWNSVHPLVGGDSSRGSTKDDSTSSTHSSWIAATSEMSSRNPATAPSSRAPSGTKMSWAFSSIRRRVITSE